MRTLIALVLLTWLMTPSQAQITGQKNPAAECLRLDAGPSFGFGDEADRTRENWVAVCRQALDADPGNQRIKQVLARSLMANGQRADAIPLWRELADQNNAAAAFEIYDMYKSYFRDDVTAPQLVKRDEAERNLRKAAELGDTYAVLMLAVLLDRGSTVKRDPTDAIYWARRAVDRPDKSTSLGDMQVLLGCLLVKSPDADERARGLDLLGRLVQLERGDAKTELAIAIRADDPVRARKLLEEGLRGYAGGAIPPLADMLIKGEGGPADPKRAVSLITGRSASDVPCVKGAHGDLLIEGKLLPRNLQEGVGLLSICASWDYDARLRLMAVLAANPELTLWRPQYLIYDATEAADLGEPGAAA
ncbi:MAG: tetratricopeptide repeat protein, partial [Rhizomicrobium sp.]